MRNSCFFQPVSQWLHGVRTFFHWASRDHPCTGDPPATLCRTLFVTPRTMSQAVLFSLVLLPHPSSKKMIKYPQTTCSGQKKPRSPQQLCLTVGVTSSACQTCALLLTGAPSPHSPSWFPFQIIYQKFSFCSLSCPPESLPFSWSSLTSQP